ncbi:general secretion pathway protein GspK, partial [Pseudomonas sp. MAFF212428]|nr:general secretion pathway protein GspK [Pseudomonas brassicae]
MILVLWALAVLSLLAANVVASVRLENRQGHNEL